METSLQQYVEQQAASTQETLSPSAVVEQVALIQQIMHRVMKEGEHFGSVPGCGNKPVLLKPGAEKLCLTFRLAPRYVVTRHDLENDHREYEVLCELIHIPTGRFVGQGVGLCSTLESKYRYRSIGRKCPECGAETIVKGKTGFGGGWICLLKKGGCGARFNEHDPKITGQASERSENPDLADTYNTVLKMAKKRAHVDAVLTATAASDLFTQDLDDHPAGSSAPSSMPVRSSGKSGKEKTIRKTMLDNESSTYKKRLLQLEGVLAARRPDDLADAIQATEKGIASWPQPFKQQALNIVDRLRKQVISASITDKKEEASLSDK